MKVSDILTKVPVIKSAVSLSPPAPNTVIILPPATCLSDEMALTIASSVCA